MTDDIVARVRFGTGDGLRAHDWMNEAADRIEKLEAALRDLIAACDAGRHVERGIGGMTIAAQIDRTVIGGIRARAVEDARVALEGEKADV